MTANARSEGGEAPKGSDRLGDAILRALAYSDVFDHPLTAAELTRFLPEVTATVEDVERVLRVLPGVRGVDGVWMLEGREANASVRRRRLRSSERLWRSARRWSRLLRRLPFVRMIAVTGALAVDGADDDADIDFLVVAAEGRVWICRALVTAVARLAKLFRTVLCPNYVLGERALHLREHDLYAARELAQMVPLVGLDAYLSLREANAWAETLLPNAAGLPCPGRVNEPGYLPRAFVEWLLRGSLGGRIEQMAERLQRRHLDGKLRRAELSTGEASFTPNGYKGHFDGHGGRILTAYQARLARLRRTS